MSEVLLKVENLVKHFPIMGGVISKKIGDVKSVSDVSFEVKKGETLGLVGESGCGKSTLAKCLVRLENPTSGKIIFKNQDITHIEGKELRDVRKKIQMIFQDPFASLNPRMTIGSILEEPLIIHNLYNSASDRRDRIHELCDLVGLRKDTLSRYPHEFSGGQRQRVGIARALAVNPELILCDEPVSALDVSIQAQIINLLMDLQQKLGITYIFIAHDLKVVEHVSTKVAVMYLGKIVEMAEADELYKNPQHPYTRALMSAIPVPDPRAKDNRIILTGDVPSPINPPAGCYFNPRCSKAADVCRAQYPQTRDFGGEHLVSCSQV